MAHELTHLDTVAARREKMTARVPRFIWTVCVVATWLASHYGAALAQPSFTQGTEVVVAIEALRVRSAPGLDADQVGRQVRGARGVVVNPSPHWADGYWWWEVAYADGVVGWSADSDAELRYLEAISAGSAAALSEEALRRRLEDGRLTFMCNDSTGGRSGTGEVAYRTRPCPPDARVSFNKHLEPDLWELHDPSIWLLGTTTVALGRLYFVHASLAELRGTGGFGLFSLYLERPDGELILAYSTQHQGVDYDPAEPARVSFRTRVYLPGDPNSSPSFMIHDVYEATDTALVQVGRHTVLTSESELARQVNESPLLQTHGIRAIQDLINEVNSIALDPTLSQLDRERHYQHLQDSWDAELLATAVRLVPVFDSRQGRWRSFDAWARDEASSTGVDAPFAHDPVGSTVRMIFDPSAENISRQLGLELPW